MKHAPFDMKRRQRRRRLTIALGLALLTGIILSARVTGTEGQPAPALAPPAEVTPEIVAMRGCIEGIAHPSEQSLTAREQRVACNDYVRLAKAEDRPGATYMRALNLFENGQTAAHRAQAMRDFTFVIDAGHGNPSAFANRAWLAARDGHAPEAAFADIDRAIAMTAERPRKSYFERRAFIRLQLARRNADPAQARAALEDLDTALKLAPNSTRALRLRTWARDFLKQQLRQQGAPLRKG